MLKPRTASKMPATTTIAPTTVQLRLRLPIKSKLAPWNHLREIEVLNVMFWNLGLEIIHSITRRVANTAVKNEHAIPIIYVVAKPLIGPEPLKNKMIPVITEVKFESKIAENAFL